MQWSYVIIGITYSIDNWIVSELLNWRRYYLTNIMLNVPLLLLCYRLCPYSLTLHNSFTYVIVYKATDPAHNKTDWKLNLRPSYPAIHHLTACIYNTYTSRAQYKESLYIIGPTGAFTSVKWVQSSHPSMLAPSGLHPLISSISIYLVGWAAAALGSC